MYTTASSLEERWWYKACVCVCARFIWLWEDVSDVLFMAEIPLKHFSMTSVVMSLIIFLFLKTVAIQFYHGTSSRHGVWGENGHMATSRVSAPKRGTEVTD